MAGGVAPALGEQFRRTWRYGRRLILRQHPAITAFYIAASVASAVIMMIVPQLFGEITNTLQKASASSAELSRTRLLWLFAAWTLFLLILRPLITLLVRVITVRLDNRVGLDLSHQLFRKVLAQPLGYFHQSDSGRLTYLLREMSIQAQMAIRQLTIDPILLILSLLTGLGFVIYNYLQLAGGQSSIGSWLVVAALLVLGLAAPLLVSRFAPGLQAASRDMRERESALAALLQGALQSPEEIQSFNAVDYLGQRHDNARRHLNATRERQTVEVEKVNFFNTIPSDLTQVLLVGAAVFIAFTTDSIDRIGSLVAILLLVPQLMRPIQGLSSIIVSLKTAWPSIEAVLDLVETTRPGDSSLPGSDQISSPDADGDTKSRAAIAVRDLHFHYQPSLPAVFRGATFSLPAGSTSTIVARMGEGKTTLFRLLLRFYRPESGELEIDGKPIDNFSDAMLRDKIALLSQFPAFTHDSVRDNLRLAAPEADDATLLKVCRSTGLLAILSRKIEGNESAVLDAPFASGTMFSGGQRRLFALTRCLLRQPEILLLDEPTTGLDNAEKAALIPVLQKLFTDRTVVIVDHDTRWLHRICDHFVVLENGLTQQYSDRDTVLRDSELFAQLFQSIDQPTAPDGDHG